MNINIRKTIFLLLSLYLATFSLRGAKAEDIYCEVMSVKGEVTVVQNGAVSAVKQGDHLKAGDAIKVGENSFVDLAYDKLWSNVTRIRENSEVKIGSIEPTHIDMKQGDIFSKIKALSTNSSFEIQTPTAVASVRGTEFDVFAGRDGSTVVSNFSPTPNSIVEVAGLDVAGNKQPAPPVMLTVGNKTEIPELGKAPTPPQPISPELMAKNAQDSVGTKDKGSDDKKIGQGPGGPGNGPEDVSSNTSDSTMTGGIKPITSNPEPPNSLPTMPADVNIPKPPTDFSPPQIPDRIDTIQNIADNVQNKTATITDSIQNQTFSSPPPTPDMNMQSPPPTPSPSPS